MSASATRTEIVAAADGLFYRQGYEHTSFADISEAVNISRGNFYYHFKTKDEILDAVIVARLQKTQTMLDRWEEIGETPQARILSFIHILIANRADIKRYGCPVGTLTTELAKLGHAAQAEANNLFSLFRLWLRGQFDLLGCRNADSLALHILVRSQGIATLANAFKDDAFIRREVADIEAWLQKVLDDVQPRPRARKS
jgi:TetR/AcrR family transcriptional regulator, transcriptional repressor for nem operon